jgi:UDP-glucose 4-epimerase
MIVLVIGSKGFVGGHAVAYFNAKGNTVIGCDIQRPDGDETYLYFNTSAAGAGLQDVFKKYLPDVCINAGGNGSVPISIANPQLDFEANTLFQFTVLEIIKNTVPHCKYVHLSSAAVYGNPRQLPIAEQDATLPLSPYGWHKLQAELVCKEYAHLYNIPAISLRIFSVYGPGLKKQLFWDTYHKTKTQQQIALFGTGNESRDFIYIDDLIAAIDIIISGYQLNGQQINVSSGVETTVKEAIQLFIDGIDKNKEIVFNNITKSGDPLNWRADITELTNLGFVPKINLQQGLLKTIEWLKGNA